MLPGVIAVAGSILLTGGPRTAGELPADWCPTGEAAAGPSCTRGTCDDPAERDQWSPAAYGAIFTIRLKFNVFCENTGPPNCAATQADVNAQLGELNTSFLQYGIQFVQGAPAEFINNSCFYHLCSDVPACRRAPSRHVVRSVSARPAPENWGR